MVPRKGQLLKIVGNDNEKEIEIVRPRRRWRLQRDIGDSDKKACTVELFPLHITLVARLIG
jgi:hypothetical protein